MNARLLRYRAVRAIVPGQRGDGSGTLRAASSLAGSRRPEKAGGGAGPELQSGFVIFGFIVWIRSAHTLLSELRYRGHRSGLLVALGMLAMTIGLIRSATSSDLRTLAGPPSQQH